MHVGDIMSTLHTGGCSVHWGFQIEYKSKGFCHLAPPICIMISPRCTEHTQCTHDIPQCTHGKPMY